MKHNNTIALLITVAMSNSIHTVADALSASASASQQQQPSPHVVKKQQQHSNKNNNKNWLVVDFDGTCTARDTITMLPRLAALAQSSKQTDNDGVLALSPDAVVDFQSRLSIFNILEDDYFRRYTEVLRLDSEATAVSSKESEKNNTSSNNNNNRKLLEEQQLAESIDRLDNVSTEITHEVSRWRVLGGLGGCTHTEISALIDLYKEKQTELEPSKIGDSDKETNYKELLESLALKQGCLSVLRRCARNQNYGIGVLSINWCPALIESILVHPLCAAGENENDNESSSSSLPSFEDVPIWSNSLDADGVVALPFPGAIAKKKQILKLQQQQQQHRQGNDAAARVVYVGDSSTDLLAMIQADVGILLGRSKSAIGLASKYGVLVKPLRDYDYSDNDNTEVDGASVVWTADNWDEIGSFFDRTQRNATKQ